MDHCHLLESEALTVDFGFRSAFDDSQFVSNGSLRVSGI